MKRFSTSLALIATLACGWAAPLRAQPAAKGAAPRKVLKVHPKVEPDQDCAECHGGTKDSPADAWEASKHGRGLIKCLVCHGSTGKDFVARPGTRACQGCHAAQVASLPKAKAGSCFGCHAPHSLVAKKNIKNPHGN